MILFEIIYGITSFIAYVLLIWGADEYNDATSVFLAPAILWRMVFGKARYFLIPVVLYFATIFVPALVWLVILCHVVFSIALGTSYGKSALFKAFLVFVPGIAVIVLAFSGSEYQGEVDVAEIIAKIRGR